MIGHPDDAVASVSALLPLGYLRFLYHEQRRHEHVILLNLSWRWSAFAWAFSMFHILGVFVHRPIKQLWKGTSETSFSVHMHLHLGLCMIVYLLLYGCRYAFVGYYRKLMLSLNGARRLFVPFSLLLATFLEEWKRNIGATVDATGRLCYKELESLAAFHLFRVRRSHKYNDPIHCELRGITSAGERFANKGNDSHSRRACR